MNWSVAYFLVVVVIEDMSEDEENDTSCAYCGMEEGVDDTKLKHYDGCDLVKYCSDECHQLRKSDIENECKIIAAALARDKLLFTQPESTHMGDCPICCLPLLIDLSKSTFIACCSNYICNGCRHATTKRAVELSSNYESIVQACPFCREPIPKTIEEADKQLTKRIEANDPVALREEGADQCRRGNYTGAFEYWSKAAQLGDADGHYQLAKLYHNGDGVERDRGKEFHHMEKAAIGGHPKARYTLGSYEKMYGNTERAVKHWVIAAAQGEPLSIDMLMDAFKSGFVRKEVLAASLRAQQAAVDATKSPQREEAEEFQRGSLARRMEHIKLDEK